MSDCMGCKYADWKRTKTGRLHPDKSGRCGYLRAFPIKIELPAAFYFIGLGNSLPQPSGGRIERGEHHKTPCPTRADAIPDEAALARAMVAI